MPRKASSEKFATTIGVLIVTAVFGLAIGVALFVQNERHGKQQIWPFTYLKRSLGGGVGGVYEFHWQNGYGRV